MPEAKERIHWVDVAKGVLILLLLLHHFTSASLRLGIDTSSFWFVNCWEVVYTCFFMQAFFFLSGYCSNFSTSFRPFFVKLLKQLVIPFICFQFIICVWQSIPLHGFSPQGIFKVWIDNNGTTLWFLNALIVSKIFVWVILHFRRSNLLLLVLSFLVLFLAVFLKQHDLGSNFFFIRQSLASVFFVALGYVMKGNRTLFDKMTNVCGGIFPYLLLVLLLFRLPIPEVTAVMSVGMLSVPVFLVLSICGTFACVRLCMLINNSVFLEYFGKNTLVIYCLHFIILISLADFYYHVLKPSGIMTSVLYVSVLYISVIAVCFVLVELFKWKPFRWMIGRF